MSLETGSEQKVRYTIRYSICIGNLQDNGPCLEPDDNHS
ncbi:hypothetical protein BH23THE1_BH23THE1_17580 [soil metagenome]